jgi:hypothetical protein
MDTWNWLHSAYHCGDIGDSDKESTEETLAKEKSMGTDEIA